MVEINLDCVSGLKMDDGVRLDIPYIAKEVVKELLGSGSLMVLVANDENEKQTLMNAHKAFSCLHEILWGEFYEKHIHHGSCAEFKTPDEAVDAYREFIGKCITDEGISELI